MSYFCPTCNITSLANRVLRQSGRLSCWTRRYFRTLISGSGNKIFVYLSFGNVPVFTVRPIRQFLDASKLFTGYWRFVCMCVCRPLNLTTLPQRPFHFDKSVFGINIFRPEQTLSIHTRRVYFVLKTFDEHKVRILMRLLTPIYPRNKLTLLFVCAVSYTHLDVYKRQEHVIAEQG